MEELTRRQLLEKKFQFPSEMIKLIPTNHFTARLEERGLGLACIPTLVRITEDNVHSGKTKDGKTLSSVVVRLEYNKRLNIFLALSPKDGALKTLSFRERRRDGSRGRRKRTNV